MAGGVPDGWLLEFEATAGVWTDITADVRSDAGVEIHYGRDTQSDDGQPGTISFTLNNRTGKYTIDNPTSAFWPNIVEGKRVRFTGTKGSTTAGRGTFFIRRWQLNIAVGFADSTVTVSGVDRLGSLNVRDFDSDLIEQWRQCHPTDGTNFCDIYRFKDDGTPQAPNNVGHLVDGTDPDNAFIVQNTAHTGDINYVPAEGLITEGCIEFVPKALSGSVLSCPVQSPSREFMFWFRTYAAPPATSTEAYLAEGKDASGKEIWSIRYKDTGSNYEVHWWVNNADIGPLDNAAYFGDWHSIYMLDGGAGTIQLFYDSFTGDPTHVAAFGDFSTVTTVNIGGRIVNGVKWMPHAKRAINVPRIRTTIQCVHMWAAFVMVGGQVTFGGFEPYGRAGRTIPANTRFSNYMAWAAATGTAYTGTDPRPVAAKSSQGRTVTECVQELARTLAATVWCRPTDDKIEFLTGDSLRPIAPSFPIYLEADDEISLGQSWSRGTVENPTRQTVTSPAGDGTYIDHALEDATERRDGGSVDSMHVSVEDARSLAAFLVGQGKKRRLQQFGVDPVTAIGAGFDTGETATATGTPLLANYLIASNADAADVAVGDLVRLYTSAGVLKEDTVFRVTAMPSAGGFTNITVDPAFQTGIVTAGDQLHVAQPLWEALLTELQPGTRIQLRTESSGRASNWAILMGRTTEDVHVLGWTERWHHNSVEFVFDTVPADSPSEGVYDDDLYGRCDFGLRAADGLGDCRGSALTSSGTSLTLTTTLVPLTVDAGDYPLYLRVDGEDMLVAAAPASAVSPQTVTVVRAQLGSVAVAHAAASVVVLSPAAGYAP